MEGGVGNDTYFIDNVGDRAIETLAGAAGGVDLVNSAVNWTLGDNFENLRLYGTAISGIGNALNNVLTGNASANVLNGRAGNDTLHGNAGNDSLDGWSGADLMDGGAGDDAYFIDNVGDRVVETLAGAEGGVDLVSVAFDWTLGDNFENLRLYGTAINGTGNDLANVITGNSSANVLVGGYGNDTLDGGAGDDTFIGWGGYGLQWEGGF